MVVYFSYGLKNKALSAWAWIMLSNVHRVDRVPGIPSSRPNWLPRPYTFKRVLPPPSFVPGGGTHSPGEEGAGGADSDEETDTLVLEV